MWMEQTFTPAQARKAVFAAWGGKCAYCLQRPAEELDHIYPRARGGQDVLSNYAPACWTCNVTKRDMILGDGILAILTAKALKKQPKVLALMGRNNPVDHHGNQPMAIVRGLSLWELRATLFIIAASYKPEIVIGKGVIDFDNNIIRKGASDNKAVRKVLDRLLQPVLGITHPDGKCSFIPLLENIEQGWGKHILRLNPDATVAIAQGKFGYRIDTAVVLALTSRYSLYLYAEALRRVYAKGALTPPATLSLAEFREFMSIPSDKLTSAANIMQIAIKKPVAELNDKAGLKVVIEPVKCRRAIIGYKIHWRENLRSE